MTISKYSLNGGENLERFMAGLPYNEIYGGTIDSWYKPFTTNPAATGFSRYKVSLFAGTGLVGSGNNFVGADSSGLNPFGPYTLNEGIISGPNRSSDLEASIVIEDVRTFGNKAPMNLVGWGFDQFGYPSPNQNIRWHTSGIYQGLAPSSYFLSTGVSPFSHGRNVNPAHWNAGPLDMRWDIYRKVWTPPQSVYSARVTAAFSSGVAVTNFGTAVSASGLRYNAQIFDGVANRISVTGAIHVGPKPYNDTFKVYPLASGSFCFVVHTTINGIPGYGVYLVEPPGTVECETSSSGTSDSGSSSSFLTYSNLVASPLSKSYGGTGFEDHPSGTILLGNPVGSGDLKQYSLQAGTGIEFVNDGTTFTVKIASGVLLTAAGVNSSINQLTGLTTPLSLGQGGTGASSKNFLDLTTAQSTVGHKTFSSGVRVSSGNYSVPGLTFTNRTTTGLYALTDRNGVGVSSSGIQTLKISDAGSVLYSDCQILATIVPAAALNNNSYAPLIVTQYGDINYTNPIQIWNDRSNITLSYVDTFGRFIGQSFVCSGMTSSMAAATGFHMLSLCRPNNTFRNSTISATAATSGVYFSVNWDGTQVTMGASGSQTAFISPSGNRTINWGSGYTGDVPVAKVGGGTRTLSFDKGLFTGYVDS